MAVAQGGDRGSDRGGDRGGGGPTPERRLAVAPGRDAPFEIDARSTPFYRACRWLALQLVRLWFRPSVAGPGTVPATGPVILAPVHRSGVDFCFSVMVTDRKLFFMAKDNLWGYTALGRLLAALGAFPVHRESADRQALQRAEEVLRQGQVLVLFPEGTRQEGPEVQELLEGATFLAARTGAVIVPVGIGHSDRAMPKGSRLPKPVSVSMVVGDGMRAPDRGESGRVSRGKVHQATVELRRRIQEAYDAASTS